MPSNYVNVNYSVYSAVCPLTLSVTLCVCSLVSKTFTISSEGPVNFPVKFIIYCYVRQKCLTHMLGLNGSSVISRLDINYRELGLDNICFFLCMSALCASVCQRIRYFEQICGGQAVACVYG